MKLHKPWIISAIIISFAVSQAIPVVALNEVVDIIHVRDLWTAEWMAPNGTVMHGVTGKGAGVAVIDTGLDGTHPDFIGHVSYNGLYLKDIGWTDFIESDVDPLAQGHGTFNCGIVGGSGASSDGEYIGVAPECNLISLCGESFIYERGPIGMWPTIGLIGYANEAYRWIYENADEYNIKVVSCSFGPSNYTYNDYALQLKVVVDKNIIFCYSAGNGGSKGPSHIPNDAGIMTVGGTTKEGKMWANSAQGCKSNESTWPSVVAPSCLVVSTMAKSFLPLLPLYLALYPENAEIVLKGYIREYGNGTSFSNPQVAGVCALVFQINPDLTPAQVKQIIELTADPIFGPYNETGWFAGHGLVNGTRAVAVAHYMALRSNTTVDEALKYYRVLRKTDGKIVLNPLPLPEIPKNETTNSTTQVQKQFIPGFEFVFLVMGIFFCC